VDQLKEVEMLRPLRLFLGLSGINQQSQSLLYTGAEFNRLYPVYIISTSNQATQRQNEASDA